LDLDVRGQIFHRSVRSKQDMLTGFANFGTVPFQRAFADFDALSREMDRWFAAPRRSPVPEAPLAQAVRVELDETPEAFLLRAEVPGLSREQLTLRVEDGILTLEGRREVNVPEGFSALRRERNALALSRRFHVPREVDAEKIEASLKHGVLSVTLPKTAAAKPRQIAIQTR
jgi:HSP20 family protein